MTAEPDALRLVKADHDVIARCVERQPKLYVRGQHEGYYIHSDIADIIYIIGRLAAAPAVQPAAGREEIARIIDPMWWAARADYERTSGTPPVPLEKVAQDPNSSIAKADRILAALSPQPGPASEGDGE